jgi:hypothetical protein
LRCEKNSIRAKVYRGRGNVSAAYDTKNWAMGELCRVLVNHSDRLGIMWGWQTDPEQEYHSMVLYVELPGYGQASFHSKDRYEGPDFPKEWDGVRGKSAERIVRFAGDVLAGMFCK